jgi:dipeptidase D
LALAVLEDKTLKHPPIEAFFTVDEETGMYGAEGFDYSNLKGKTLINIDSEDEGVLTVGCAGGARTDITLPLEKVNLNGSVISIKIDGLLGGHSGVEINKGRHNANVLMGKFLNKIGKFNLVSLDGGKKDNVIPSVCQAIISAECDVSAIAKSFIAENLLETDPKLSITVESLSNVDFKTCYSAEASKKAAELICALPNGIIKMCPDIKGLVQTSLNMGVMEAKDNSLHISFAVRSSVNEEKTELIKVVEDTAKSFGAEIYSHSHYPAWEYKKASPLRETMSAVYKELYKQDVVVEVIHAGLECGLFCDRIKDLDAVSFGPDLYDIHSPFERVSISSVERCYEFLVKILEKL